VPLADFSPELPAIAERSETERLQLERETCCPKSAKRDWLTAFSPELPAIAERSETERLQLERAAIRPAL
jgi:hypothetical protein